MAYKSTGTASKSASGASMSKYDVEVEARLKKLEAAVKELKAHSHDAPATSAVDIDDATCAKVEQYLKDHGAI